MLLWCKTKRGNLIEDPSAEFIRSADGSICVAFVICITDLPFLSHQEVFLPGCLVGTATGIWAWAVCFTCSLNIDQSLWEEKPATY